MSKTPEQIIEGVSRFLNQRVTRRGALIAATGLGGTAIVAKGISMILTPPGPVDLITRHAEAQRAVENSLGEGKEVLLANVTERQTYTNPAVRAAKALYAGIDKNVKVTTLSPQLTMYDNSTYGELAVAIIRKLIKEKEGNISDQELRFKYRINGTSIAYGALPVLVSEPTEDGKYKPSKLLIIPTASFRLPTAAVNIDDLVKVTETTPMPSTLNSNIKWVEQVMAKGIQEIPFQEPVPITEMLAAARDIESIIKSVEPQAVCRLEYVEQVYGRTGNAIHDIVISNLQVNRKKQSMGYYYWYAVPGPVMDMLKRAIRLAAKHGNGEILTIGTLKHARDNQWYSEVQPVGKVNPREVDQSRLLEIRLDYPKQGVDSRVDDQQLKEIVRTLVYIGPGSEDPIVPMPTPKGLKTQ